MIRLAVFDMAGTTIDEQGLVYVALREAVEATGATVAAADLETWMGRDKEEAIWGLMELGGQTPDADRVAAAFKDFSERLTRKYTEVAPRALAGVREAFDAVHAAGGQVYLTTGFKIPVVESLLAGLGWDGDDVIDGWFCTDHVPTGRPAPYLIYRAMEAAGIHDAAEVLVAGDTIADVKSGLNARAGVVIGVTTGDVSRATLEAAGAHHVLDSLADIAPLLTAEPAAV
ncbi:phosphonatase-like hydrolase [Demequina pelophila]|uniref:phosphonatase-like hydrolase n=1 Tax=Demequina pelophila TaxID=1638984 RepID=UPI000782B01A|nr:phosphonatase-like hydrolase [Demequina pelophila]